MGVIRCQHCGAWVNEEAMGCPDCGADPRSGVVPGHVDRWEKVADVWEDNLALFDEFTTQALAEDLPPVDELLTRCEATSCALLAVLPHVIEAWRLTWMEVAPRMHRSVHFPDDSFEDVAALLTVVEDALAGAGRQRAGMYLAVGVFRAITKVDLGDVMDGSMGTDNPMAETVAERTRMAHKARALLELEYSQLRWRLERSGERLDTAQAARLASVLDDVGPLFGGLGLQTTLARCALHPGSRWETVPATEPADSTIDGREEPGL
jgi:hypothetical protein